MPRLNFDHREIACLTNRARLLIVQPLARVGVGHLGGCLSCVDILAALYFGVMNVDPENPRLPERDRFVLSKGHAGPALYSILALRGFFPVDRLNLINTGGTWLPSHADMNRTPGVDMTAGSLGQGVSCAVGMAYAAKLDGKPHRVYALLGDGECQEGEVWEAAMSAGAFKLDNLTVIVDDNKLQIDGFTSEVVSLEPLAMKWQSFGFNVLQVDGHNVERVLDALGQAAGFEGAPTCIVAHTVKCRGVPSFENQPACHNMAVTEKHVAEVYQWLKSRNGEPCGGLWGGSAGLTAVGGECATGKSRRHPGRPGLTIIASGFATPLVLEAAALLAAMGISAEIINLTCIKPLDEDVIIHSAAKTGLVVTVENASILGGIGGAVAELLSEQYPVHIKRLGIRDEWGEVGRLDYLAERYGLTPHRVSEAVRSFVRETVRAPGFRQHPRSVVAADG